MHFCIDLNATKMRILKLLISEHPQMSVADFNKTGIVEKLL